MRFLARALDAHQQLVSIDLEAADAESAQAQVQQSGLVPVSVAPVSGTLRAASTKFPLLLFVQELHALLVAGLSVIESLEVLLEKEPSEGNRAVLSRLSMALREGQRLSAALARQPQVFPSLFVGILQAAEGTSDLPLALSRYLDYETRLGNVRQKIVSASIYPAILVCVGGGVATFLLGYVVPRFALVYRGSGRALPWASQLLVDWGGFAQSHAVEILATLALGIAAGAMKVRRHLRDGTWWRLLAIIPGTRPKLEMLEVSRFYLTLGMLLQGGLPIVPALELARSVLPAERRAAVDRIRSRIESGESLSDVLVAAGLSTPVALRLIKVGEQSGQLATMLIRTAEFYEGETTRWIERFTKVFEPTLMAAIGLLIGSIVILLYMPIFDLASSLQ